MISRSVKRSVVARPSDPVDTFDVRQDAPGVRSGLPSGSGVGVEFSPGESASRCSANGSAGTGKGTTRRYEAPEASAASPRGRGRAAAQPIFLRARAASDSALRGGARSVDLARHTQSRDAPVVLNAYDAYDAYAYCLYVSYECFWYNGWLYIYTRVMQTPRVLVCPSRDSSTDCKVPAYPGYCCGGSLHCFTAGGRLADVRHVPLLVPSSRSLPRQNGRAGQQFYKMQEISRIVPRRGRL